MKNWRYLKMRGRNQNSEWKFELVIKFRVEWYIMVIGFTLSCQCFLLKSRLRRREKQYSLKTSLCVYQTYYHNISFDAEFYDKFEFYVEVLFCPRIFAKIEILKICVGGSKNFSQIWRENGILFGKMCICWYFINLYRSNRKCSKSRNRRKFLNSNFQGIRQKFWYSRKQREPLIYF